jgi:hypothetical protein
MYKVVIEIGDWDWAEDERVTVETSDFEKAQVIQEFIEFQKEFGWAADYQLSDEFVDAQCDEEEVSEYDDSYNEDDNEIVEDEEFAEYEIGEIVEDEDGLLWKRVA